MSLNLHATEALFARVKAAWPRCHDGSDPGFNMAAFCRHLGVNKSDGTHWVDGDFEAKLPVLRELARYLIERDNRDPLKVIEVCYGDDLRALGFVAEPAPVAAGDLQSAASRVVGGGVRLLGWHAKVTAPESDGGSAVTPAELREAAPILAAVDADLTQARAHAAPVAVRS